MNPDRVAPSEIARSRALGVRKWLAQQPSPDIERRQKAELGDTAIEPNERESAAVSNDIGQLQSPGVANAIVRENDVGTKLNALDELIVAGALPSKPEQRQISRSGDEDADTEPGNGMEHIDAESQGTREEDQSQIPLPERDGKSSTEKLSPQSVDGSASHSSYDPSKIPLPDQDGSSGTENLVRQSKDGSGSHESVDPSEIPLPERDGSSGPENLFSQSVDSSATRSDHEARRERYRRAIDLMHDRLPGHLYHTASEDVRYHDVGMIRILDIPHIPKHGKEGKEWYQPDNETWWKDPIELENKVLGNDIEQVRCRIALVEDLSPELIDSLGAVFAINPEFFEEHLNSSQYNISGNLPVNRPSFQQATHDFQHISIRWWRPLYRKSFRQNKPISSPVIWRSLMKTGFNMRRLKSRSTHIDNTSTTVHRRNILHEHTLRPNTNIFRQEWNLSPVHREETRSDVNRTAVGWEERLTVHCQVIGRCSLFLILVDPLPEIHHLHETTDEDTKEKNLRSAILFHHRHIAPRGFFISKIATSFSDEEVKALCEYRRQTQSTQDDLGSWIKNKLEHVSDDQYAWAHPCLAIAQVLRADIVGFSQLIRGNLDSINHSSVNEVILQDSLQHWQQFLAESVLQLTKLRRSVDEMRPFFKEAKAPDDSIATLDDIVTDLGRAIDACEKSQNLLRSSINILDSRRSIAQAESVGKLTELGFVFLPVSLASSLFSMQIQELQIPRPVWEFAVTALGMIFLAYFMRLLVRSSLLLEPRKRIIEDIRKHAKKNRNQAIRTREVLQWITYQIFRADNIFRLSKVFGIKTTFRRFDSNKVLFAAALLASCAPVIVFIWRGVRLGSGFNGMITVIVLFTMTCPIWLYGVRWLFDPYGIFDVLNSNDDSSDIELGPDEPEEIEQDRHDHDEP